MTLAINSRSQHAALAIHARVDDEKIVILREAVFVDQMAASLLPVTTDFVAAFHKASECLVAAFTLSRYNWVVIFRNVQLQEVSRGEVGFAF